MLGDKARVVPLDLTDRSVAQVRNNSDRRIREQPPHDRGVPQTVQCRCVGEADGSDNPADVIAIMIAAPVAPRLSAAAQQQWRIRRTAGGSLPQQRCEPNPYWDRATFQHLPRAVARAAFARARYPQPRLRRVSQIEVRDLHSRHLRWSRAGRRRDLDHEPESAITIISGRDDA